jgi:hypothetical protein
VLDEFSHESLAIRVARKLKTIGVWPSLFSHNYHADASDDLDSS